MVLVESSQRNVLLKKLAASFFNSSSLSLKVLPLGSTSLICQSARSFFFMDLLYNLIHLSFKILTKDIRIYFPTSDPFNFA